MSKSTNVVELTPPVEQSQTRFVTLAGNPNSGKTSLFNALTGAYQHVGNYAGVTVERKEGLRRHDGLDLRIVDLPGTYSLATNSLEERIARDVLVTESPDVTVSVVDASNLERNLYLTVQLLELGLPVVVALNMVDVARSRGADFDVDKLSKLLRSPVVRTVARRGEGVRDLLEAIVERSTFPAPSEFHVEYGPDLEREIARLDGLLAVANPGLAPIPRRGLAVALLEGVDTHRTRGLGAGLLRAAEEAGSRVERLLGDPPDLLIAERRHGAAAGLARQVTVRSTLARRDVTDLIDRVLVNRVLGIPIFLATMYAVFHVTFTVAERPMEWIELGFARLGEAVGGSLPLGSQSVLHSLLVDGIIGGVGGVLVFLPNIVLLFLAISLLEDSGYMARAAFVMDRVMKTVGLHGKSFIPMLLGFGCSIPAIMATRTIESRRARMTTMMVIPLMSCSARLPIYALIIPAFFAAHARAWVLWIIYLTGIALAMLCAWLLRRTLFAGEGLPFLMELPPYRAPTLRSIARHVVERSWLYVQKAGTIILGISIVMWALATFPRLDPVAWAADSGVAVQDLDDDRLASARLDHSLAGRIGHAMEPLVAPMGFDWKIGTALVGAFAAKEVFVAQLGIVYSVASPDETGAAFLRERLRADYSPLVGFCIMLFALIATPCMATVAVVRRESGSWGWAAFQFLGLTALAWVVTVIVFQTGTALGLGV
ncbi:MAG TPA: ferrous iron transport protein B [Methylomirabilota bacterium]|nr:ferrous iron transport protein B [Methylomirabilota bacterium]